VPAFGRTVTNGAHRVCPAGERSLALHSGFEHLLGALVA
jgi:hypothetical protein